MIPEGGRIVEACEHGNPMDASCKLCGRLGDPAGSHYGATPQDPLAGEKVELLAIAFGLLVAVDAKKPSDEWLASFAEWKERYARIDPRGSST